MVCFELALHCLNALGLFPSLPREIRERDGEREEERGREGGREIETWASYQENACMKG